MAGYIKANFDEDFPFCPGDKFIAIDISQKCHYQLADMEKAKGSAGEIFRIYNEDTKTYSKVTLVWFLEREIFLNPFNQYFHFKAVELLHERYPTCTYWSMAKQEEERNKILNELRKNTASFEELGVKKTQVYRICGCTEFKACLEGCYWVESDLCSVCSEKAKENEGSE